MFAPLFADLSPKSKTDKQSKSSKEVEMSEEAEWGARFHGMLQRVRDKAGQKDESKNRIGKNKVIFMILIF